MDTKTRKKRRAVMSTASSSSSGSRKAFVVVRKRPLFGKKTNNATPVSSGVASSHSDARSAVPTKVQRAQPIDVAPVTASASVASSSTTSRLPTTQHILGVNDDDANESDTDQNTSPTVIGRHAADATSMERVSEIRDTSSATTHAMRQTSSASSVGSTRARETPTDSGLLPPRKQARARTDALLVKHVDDAASLSTDSRKNQSSSRASKVSSHDTQRVVARINTMIKELSPQEQGHPALQQVPHLHGPSALTFAFVRRRLARTAADTNYPYFSPRLVDKARAELHVSSREYEETNMLRTPVRSEPACTNGDECEVFNLVLPPHEGTLKPLVAYFYQPEWDTFQHQLTLHLNNGAPAPEPPRQGMQCLLCLRSLATRTVMQARLQNLTYTVEGNVPIMHAVGFYNQVNVQGEYPSESCWLPLPAAYHGVLMPIVRHDVFGFVAEYVPQQSCIKLRQVLPSLRPK